MALVDSNTVLLWLGLTPTTSNALERALTDLLTPIAITMVKEEVGYEIEFDTFIEYHPRAEVVPVEDELIEGWEVVGGKAVPRGPRGQKARAIIQLGNLPVREIVSVYDAPAAWDTYPPDWPGGTLLTEGSQYRVDYAIESYPGTDPDYPRMSQTGHLIRRVGVWSPVGRSVKVTYKAGYTATEIAGRWSVFRYAAMQAAAMFVKEAKLNALRGGNTGSITAITIDGYSRTFQAANAMTALGMQYALPPSVKKMLEPFLRYSKYR